jgi:hypothetical protein
MSKATCASGILGAIVSLTAVVQGMPANRGERNGIDFQIVADKMTYSPESTLHVKFLVTNTGETPLYLPRDISVCSNQYGFVFLQFLDRHDRDVRSEGCSSDSWPPLGDVDALKEVSDLRFWILLKHGEIYGTEDEFKLPANKGTYRLKAELIPPGFTDKQREVLAQKGTRILQTPCAAPIVTITLR